MLSELATSRQYWYRWSFKLSKKQTEKTISTSMDFLCCNAWRRIQYKNPAFNHFERKILNLHLKSLCPRKNTWCTCCWIGDVTQIPRSWTSWSEYASWGLSTTCAQKLLLLHQQILVRLWQNLFKRIEVHNMGVRDSYARRSRREIRW